MPVPAEPSTLKEPTSLLLRQYVQSGSQAAFAKLVERYGGLVYATALRRSGGREAMAEDISQTVFADLARRAPSLAEDDRLGAWLHRRACMAAGDAMKAESRRLRRENTAAMMNAPAVDETPVWEGLAPALDESLNSLKEKDRAALVLRFFEGRSLREVGQSLGIGEDAAQKRISRATEKLRLCLTKRGLAFSATVLAACLTENTTAAVPEGFAGRMISRAPAAAGPAALIWKLLPNVAPAAAGVLIVTLASVFPLMAREKRLANGMGSPARVGPAASPAGPARTYAPGLTLDETIERLLDSFATRRNTASYPGSLVYLQRLALVSLVPSERQPEALRLLIARGEKRGLPVWSICSSEASFIRDQWIVPLIKTNSEALFEIAGEIKEDAFWFMIPGFLLAHGPSIPRPQQLNLALHMLHGAPKHRDLLDTMAAFYSGSGPRLSPFKPLVKEEDRVKLLNEAMDQMRSGGNSGWGMAAAACARKDAEFGTILDGCQALPFSDSNEVWEYTVKAWTRSAFATSGKKDGLIPEGLRQWVEKLEGKARDKAAISVFSNAPWLSIPPKENVGWEERAEWTLTQISKPSLILSECGRAANSFPKSWGFWLQKHPEVLEGQSALMPGIISSIVRGSEPTPEKLAELRPLFDAWRRADPKAVAAAAHNPDPRQNSVAKILQRLSSETP